MTGRTLLLLLLAWLLVWGSSVSAQEAPVQSLRGRIEQGEVVVYTLPELKEGEVLFVSLASTSGNLDSFLGLLDRNVAGKALKASFLEQVEQAAAGGENLFDVVPRFSDATFVAWDDDGGTGHDAALSYTIPVDGDYYLLLLSSPGQQTFGDYRLTIGLNEPQVLDGTAVATGDEIAFLDEDASRLNVAVQEIQGELTGQKRTTFFQLDRVEAGETLYLYVETLTGDLGPTLYLEDFGGKTLSAANVDGQQAVASLQYTFPADAEGYQIRLVSCCEGSAQAAGTYRLLVGLNEAAVRTGEAEAVGPAVVSAPISVRIGLKLQQITNVDQKAENFSAVASLLMEWTDPSLAFRPDDCKCRQKVYTDGNFNQFLVEVGNRWPTFTLYNQQGNRWTQNRAAVLFPDGRATYLERFSTTFQAPDFDFRQFPFDQQKFFIRVDSLYPEENYVFVDLETYTEVGTQLGEEEWIITGPNVVVSSEKVNTRDITSRYSFGFEARRHLDYYIFRILLPILVIVIVSWITFFLKSYDKRVDIAAGNLLLFIAFNFTISAELPRLGYLTLLDVILISTFMITAVVLILNVILKRLETSGRKEMAQRIDRFTIWFYPVLYVGALVGVILLFR